MNDHVSCQAVSNMCVLNMNLEVHRGGPCRLFRDSKKSQVSENSSLPSIYYGEGDAPNILKSKEIKTKYSLNSNSRVKHYYLA